MGVPADSADCYINNFCNNRAFQLPDIFSKCNWLSKKKPLPCWSGTRLMEIVDLCTTRIAGEAVSCTENYIVALIAAIEMAIDEDDMDFSKLED